MTLEVYLPKKLDVQVTAFRSNSGNYNVDYRTTETGDVNVLGTAYSRVSTGSVVNLNCLPLEASGNHVSGIDALYNEFPVDVLLQNQSTEQRHFFFMTNPYEVETIAYSHTEVETVNTTQSRMLHYYTFPDRYVTGAEFAGKTLQPVLFSSAVKATGGVVNTRDCIKLTLQQPTSNIAWGMDGNLFEISVLLPNKLTPSISYPISLVDPKYVGVGSLIIKDSSNPPKATTKNRIIAISNPDGTTNGSPILTSRLTNYNLYFEDTGTAAPTADALIVPLKGEETLLINSTIKSTSSGILGDLTTNNWSYTEVYAKELGNYFACIQVNLPEEPYVEETEVRKMKVSLNNGLTWEELDNYSEEDFSAFSRGFVSYFKSKGILCYPCEDNIFVLVNTIANNDRDFIFQYHPDFSIETVRGLATVTTENGVTIPFTTQSFPDNYSPCRIRMYGEEQAEEGLDPDYIEFGLSLPSKLSSQTLTNLFKDSLSFSVDLEQVKQTTEYSFVKIDGTPVTKTVNMSAATEADVKTLLIAELNASYTDFVFSIDGAKIKAVKAVSTNNFVTFKFSYSGLSISDSVLSLEEDDLDVVVFRGS